MADSITELEQNATDAMSAVEIVDRAERFATRNMQWHLNLWKDALDAYQSQGYIDDPEAIQIQVNRYIEAVEHNASRDAQALLPTTPYFPGRSIKYPQRASYKERVVDVMTQRGKFKPRFIDCLKPAELYGLSYQEPVWDVWETSAYDREVDMDEKTGEVRQMRTVLKSEVRDGLGFKHHKPWAGAVHPAGDSLFEKPFIIIKEALPVEEIERRLDYDGSMYKMPPGYDKASLRGAPSKRGSDEWATQWRQDLSFYNESDVGSMGILLRYIGVDRWIDIWNYEIPLLDTENRNDGFDKRIKPVVAMRINPHVGPDGFYGVGAYQRIRDLAMLDDALWSLEIDARMMANARLWVYREDMVDPEQLVATHGGKIPVDAAMSPNMSLRDAVDVFQPPSVEGFGDLHGAFQDMINSREGIQDVSRGAAPTPKQTLGATQLLSQEAATRLGHSIAYIDATFMDEMSYLCYKKCAANMSTVQYVDQGGLTWEQALLMGTTDPDDMAGGMDFARDSVERITRRQQKQESLNDWSDRYLAMLPPGSQGPLMVAEKALEYIDVFDDDERDVIFMRSQEAQNPVPTSPGIPEPFNPGVSQATPGQNQQRAVEAGAV